MTREEAIRVLEEMSLWKYCEPEAEAARVAIAALREQPRWISVEEVLPPPEGVPVLAYNRDYCFAYGHMTTAFYKNGHWHGCTGLSMTHWMPLPEPPEVEG